MGTAIRNWWTTVIGVLLGVLNYLANIDPGGLPTTGRGWAVLIISALLAALGIAAKDATVGSKPK